MMMDADALLSSTQSLTIPGLDVDSGGEVPMDAVYESLTHSYIVDKDGPERFGLAYSLRSEPRLLVTGRPGSGKTTFARRVVRALARFALGTAIPSDDPFQPSAPLIPLWLPAGRLVTILESRESSGEVPLGLPEALDAMVGPASEEVRRAVSDAGGQGLLLVVDEIGASETATGLAALRRWLEVHSESHAGLRWLLLARDSAAPSLPKEFTRQGIDTFSDQDLSALGGQICAAWWGSESERATRASYEFTAWLKERADLAALASTPVAAAILLGVARSVGRDARGRAAFYARLVAWLLARPNPSRGCTPEAAVDHLGALARAMFDAPGGAMARASLGDAASLIAARFVGLQADSIAATFLESEVLHSGILKSRQGSLSFHSAGFQDYLLAREEARELPTSIAALRPEARESQLLLAGALALQDPARLTDLVRRYGDLAETDGLLRTRFRALGRVGDLARDLEYRQIAARDPRIADWVRELPTLFDSKTSLRGVPLDARAGAADLLGMLGDPRIRPTPWITISGGEFVGQESREITAVASFELARFPVTVEEYAAFLVARAEAQNLAPPDWAAQSRYPNRPVVNVTWAEAKAYCAWRGDGVRMATDREMEWAAGGSAPRRFPWGDEAATLEFANHASKVQKTGGEPAPWHVVAVGISPAGATPDGVFDLAGNVWQWCEDYDRDFPSRFQRGGSYCDQPLHLESGIRVRSNIERRSGDVGFRLARSLPAG